MPPGARQRLLPVSWRPAVLGKTADQAVIKRTLNQYADMKIRRKATTRLGTIRTVMLLALSIFATSSVSYAEDGGWGAPPLAAADMEKLS
jgi:hypothetical protein